MGRKNMAVFLIGVFLILGGCATLPTGRPVPASESADVIRAFYEMQDRDKCPAGMDAEVTATFYGFLSSGSIDGYLMTYPPANLRFEAVNPLGLIENILAVDGRRFTYLLIRQQMAYTGELDNPEALQYITAGQAASISYWLLGRLPAKTRIAGDARRVSSGDYWLTQPDSTKILFSAGEQVVKRYVTATAGKHGRLDVSYHYPPAQKNEPECPIPDLVTIMLGGHKAMSLVIRNPYPLTKLPKKQFAVQVPAAFERIELP